MYFNFKNKYFSFNITIFKYINLIKINSIENSKDKFMVNGKEKKFKMPSKNVNLGLIIKNINFTKIIQLCDYGIENQRNLYILIAQNVITNTLYDYIRIRRSCIKLKNYSIINYEHDNLNYYFKIEEVINLITIIKILFLTLKEEVNVKVKS
jgi:hypothetical protein